ncbi:MAG: cobalamin biosynthesis protein CobW [Thermodesulfobacteriota bacterium]
MSQTTRKIPITVITGFLGAGKTTIVRNLLSQTDGRRITVIVNEFGDIGIDGEIIRDSCGCEEGEIVELSNGCLCCTVQEEFLPTMTKLVERKNDIDHIVIETSGLALPKPLVRAVNWPGLKPHFSVDSVVAVVDADGMATGEICDRKKIQSQREADDSLDHETPIEELFSDQISCADMVVLNKSDLVGERKLDEIENLLRDEMKEGAAVARARMGNISPEILLGIGAAAEDDLDSRRSHHEDHHENGGDHEHDEDIDSVVVEIKSDVSPEALMSALKKTAREHEIYRVKGFMKVSGKRMRMLVQGVGERFEGYFDRLWREDETARTRLVFIGKNLSLLNLGEIVEKNLSR